MTLVRQVFSPSRTWTSQRSTNWYRPRPPWISAR